MVKAVELYLNEDHDALAKEWQERPGRNFARADKNSRSDHIVLHVPDIANHVPHMQITWDSRISRSAAKRSRKYCAIPSPRSSLAAAKNGPGSVMCSFMLQPGEDKIVAEQLSRVLRGHSA